MPMTILAIISKTHTIIICVVMLYKGLACLFYFYKGLQNELSLNKIRLLLFGIMYVVVSVFYLFNPLEPVDTISRIILGVTCFSLGINEFIDGWQVRQNQNSYTNFRKFEIGALFILFGIFYLSNA